MLTRNQAREEHALLGHAEGAKLLFAQASPGLGGTRALRVAKLLVQRAQRLRHVLEPLHDAVVSLNRHDDGRQLAADGIAGGSRRRTAARLLPDEEFAERGEQLIAG